MIRCAALLLAAAFACAADGVVVEKAWSRATATGQETGAVYLLLRNPGGAADTLLAAESPAASSVELHQVIKGEDGVMRMRKVEGGLALPAGASLELKPGSNHIMLFGLTKPLAQGATLELTLVFATAGRVAVGAKVNSVGAMAFDE